MVLHRDLKPANLLIGGIHAAPDNTSYVGARYGMVKVADFGLSRVTTLLKADLTPATVRTMLAVTESDCSQALAHSAAFQHMAHLLHIRLHCTIMQRWQMHCTSRCAPGSDGQRASTTTSNVDARWVPCRASQAAWTAATTRARPTTGRTLSTTQSTP